MPSAHQCETATKMEVNAPVNWRLSGSRPLVGRRPAGCPTKHSSARAPATAYEVRLPGPDADDITITTVTAHRGARSNPRTPYRDR
jgi:hypothetical protein